MAARRFGFAMFLRGRWSKQVRSLRVQYKKNRCARRPAMRVRKLPRRVCASGVAKCGRVDPTSFHGVYGRDIIGVWESYVFPGGRNRRSLEILRTELAQSMKIPAGALFDPRALCDAPVSRETRRLPDPSSPRASIGIWLGGGILDGCVLVAPFSC